MKIIFDVLRWLLIKLLGNVYVSALDTENVTTQNKL